MKYVGIYWSLFAPMIKKSIRTRFDTALAERSIREGKKEYKRLLSRAAAPLRASRRRLRQNARQ